MNTTYLSNLYCYVCHYEWFPRTPKTPKICPRCKNPNWAEPLFVLGDPLRYFYVIKHANEVFEFGARADQPSKTIEAQGLAGAIRVVMEIKVRRSEGYRVIEAIESRFRDRRVKGKYYQFEPEDLATIKEILREGNFGEGVRVATIEKAPIAEGSLKDKG